MLKTVSSITNAIGALNYKGVWNASTNTPALASGVGTKGDYYVVSVAGATNLDGETLWGVGDWAVYNGAAWQRLEGGSTIKATTITASGTISGGSTIGVGAATPSASGAGITFPATQSASTDANTLDDYEEGTWSPLVQGSTTAGTGTYSASKGIYTKIGNIVTVQAYINITAHTGTGNIQLSALPFTSFATADYYGTINIGYIQNCALTAGSFPLGFISANTTFAGLYQNPTGGGAMTAVPMDTAFAIMYTATYRTV